MKNTSTKLFITLGLLTLITIGTSTFAYKGLGSGASMGSGQNKEVNMVDVNNNGIPDGQEDFDGDGIPNKDDEDYEKSYVNMKDDDGDGIANKDDEDYERVAKKEKIKNLEKNLEQKRQKLGKISDNIDGFVNKLTNKYSNLTEEEKVEKLKRMQTLINMAKERIMEKDMTETQKELYENVFDYINLAIEKQIETIEINE